MSKLVSRDASLRTKYASEFAKIIRDIEHWAGEVRITSASDVFGSTPADNDLNDAENEGERWALSCLCEALLERGALVPVSSR